MSPTVNKIVLIGLFACGSFAIADEKRLFDVTLTDAKEATTVAVGNIVPGKAAKIFLNVRNKCGRKLVFEQLTVSCGCMVLDKVKTELSANGILEIPISLKGDFSGESSLRLLTLVESAESQWPITLNCSFVKPITLDENQVVDLDEVRKSKEVELSVAIPAATKHLVDLGGIECEALGAVVTKPRFKSKGNDHFLVFECENIGKVVVRSSFVEFVRVKCASFALDVKVRFKSTSAIRVFPERSDLSRLQEGLLRVCVSGESLSQYSHFELIGYDLMGEVVPLAIEPKASLGRLKIFVPTIDPADASRLDRIVVFGRKENESDRVNIGSVTVTGG